MVPGRNIGGMERYQKCLKWRQRRPRASDVVVSFSFFKDAFLSVASPVCADFAFNGWFLDVNGSGARRKLCCCCPRDGILRKGRRPHSSQRLECSVTTLQKLQEHKASHLDRLRFLMFETR